MSEFAPTVFIRIRQTNSSEFLRVDVNDDIISFKYSDTDAAADKLVLVVDNFGLTHFDDPVWRTGSLMQVTWGYADGTMSVPRLMQIRKVTGFTQLTVEALGLEILAHKKRRCRVFENTTRSAVVTRIAKELGYATDQIFVQDTEVTHETIAQAQLTDAEFLRRLAHKEGFEWYIDFDGFHFHERNFKQRVTRTLTYYTIPNGERGSIMNISTKSDVTAKPAKVRKCGRNPVNRSDNCEEADNESEKNRQGLAEFPEFTLGVDVETMEAVVTDRSAGADTSAQQSTLASQLSDPEGNSTIARLAKALDSQETGQSIIEETPEEDSQSTKRQAARKFRKAQQEAVKLQLNCVGDPNMLAKSVFKLEGVGTRLSQVYYCKEVVHLISQSGYTMQIKCIADGTGGYERRSKLAQGFTPIQVGANKSKKPAEPKKPAPTEEFPKFELRLDATTGAAVVAHPGRDPAPHLAGQSGSED